MNNDLKRVLIVDDEEILTWIMSKTLSKDYKKYEVLIANDGEKALEIMETVHVDLVITDIRMPGLSGLDLLEEIREKYPQAKVIIMTAYGNHEVQREANERGCLHYIEKPFKIEDLRNLILEAVSSSKKGFVGQVSDLQLTDIIQLSCLSKMKTALTVSKEDQKGVIYFEDGEIRHAECDEYTGQEALFMILGWEGGDFNTMSGTEPKEKTIDAPWQELLIEAMKRKDEGGPPPPKQRSPKPSTNKKAEGAPVEKEEAVDLAGDNFDAPEIDYSTGQPMAKGEAASSRVPSSAALGATVGHSVLESIPKEDIEEPELVKPRSTKEKAGLLQEMLEEWQDATEEVQGAAVVTLEGLTLAAHANQREVGGEQLGALTASIFHVGSKSVKALQRGALEEFYLRGTNGTIHLYVIKSRAILSVLARPDANIGMVHIESREKCKRVAQILGL
jgi:CheY-like chemotaxis protein